jgi:hypothetical protein
MQVVPTSGKPHASCTGESPLYRAHSMHIHEVETYGGWERTPYFLFVNAWIYFS